ncbi:1,4-alpha-glucan branching protein GlgB [Wujia chipingensis]|uniref:1,4-alpha-glucan branching enzyme GlgB n=1 Tax=Wujia chipingensis TaxID=2763670 RepID=A0A7G9FQC1_9FIRM|nr:1,4-alpha-glucan branching protein GlgB [Wujia chipingensis]QNM00753.1 1,4-alpha-glucan branching protein GlgB [Wujia chipingensis]
MSKRKAVFAINWMEVDALVQGIHNNPHHILGMHECIDDLYINAYLPGAKVVNAIEASTKKKYTLVSERVPGFFSVVIKDKKPFEYKLNVRFDNGDEVTYFDPYVFEPVIDPIDISLFNEGKHYSIYEKMGAHPMTVDGVEGVLFAVWAPNADRVSVVGNFNNWDGRRHPMRKLDYSGIYELFIPGKLVGEIYKYEIKAKSGQVFMKSDPYAFSSEVRPANASRIVDISYKWKDAAWMEKRENKNTDEQPMAIYEMHLGSWKRPTDGREFYNYRDIASLLADYLLMMNYNYVELMPIMEHPYDPSWGYQVTGYYAPTSRYGSPADFMYFVDYLHSKGIGVILDWVPAHFPKDEHGLGRFDGTALYEHEDPKRGEHPHWGTYIYNYGRNEVRNFLVANALYWAEKYHIDGIRIDAVASMLYLDYGRGDGEWLPNIYGGNENLEAIDFIKELNSKMHELHKGVIMIAEESTAWPMMTHPVEAGGLGFDYKWNMGWMNDFLNYMKLDPLYRKYHHNDLTFSMVYAYSEKFILVLSHDEVVHEKGSMIAKMPGGYEDKFSNLRVAYGYMMTHPGKKLLFMGQEIAQFTEFNENAEVDWSLFEFDAHVFMQGYVKELNELYKTEPALYELDSSPEGFTWINCNSANTSLLSYVRKGKKESDTLLIICNFTPMEHKAYKLATPSGGRWQEIFSSDNNRYGGEGRNNKTVKQAKKAECDGQEHYISVTVPPLSISVFKKKIGK